MPANSYLTASSIKRKTRLNILPSEIIGRKLSLSRSVPFSSLFSLFFDDPREANQAARSHCGEKREVFGV